MLSETVQMLYDFEPSVGLMTHYKSVVFVLFYLYFLSSESLLQAL